MSGPDGRGRRPLVDLAHNRGPLIKVVVGMEDVARTFWWGLG